jgi:hypothetical protein
VADEPGADEDGRALVERYESLRERALGARPDGHRLGLGVLLGRGVASWMLTWRECAPTQLASASPLPAAPVGEAGEEIVRVLAAMALACTGEA